MQITQFVVGTSMAASYLFISYTLPIPQAVRNLSAAIPVASSVAQSAAAAATASAAGGWVPELKKIALRAAGAAGIAETVANARQPLGTGVVSAAAEAASKNIQQQTGVEYRMVTCLDTTGQAFAVWLNVMYLLPLTYLFVQFFIRSYLYRKDPGGKRPAPMTAAEKAGMDALKGVSREMHRAVVQMGPERNGRA